MGPLRCEACDGRQCIQLNHVLYVAAQQLIGKSERGLISLSLLFEITSSNRDGHTRLAPADMYTPINLKVRVLTPRDFISPGMHHDSRTRILHLIGPFTFDEKEAYSSLFWCLEQHEAEKC